MTAISTQEALDYVAQHPTDLVYLSPQVRFMKDKFQLLLSDKQTLVEVLDMTDYGMLNSQNILQHALDLLKVHQKI
ncbi:PTS sugar transporter subunit IIB [Enterococcus cecorum]|uniref:PTS sugar transporter subunit IIB n=1 Tax=Enterococcus cecorum TaxID=44008 RepID=UPI001F14AB0F|nr:hypothetical protein [Enterococcus cecorum]